MDRVQEMRQQRFVEKLTLQEIADLHGGISRERVRQLIGNSGPVARDHTRETFEANKHLGNTALSQMMGILKRSVKHYRNGERHEIDGGYLKVGTEAEIIVSKKLRSVGIGNKLMPHHHAFDILLNSGARVDVKSSNPLNLPNPTPPYNFNTEKHRRGHYCDFFILFLLDQKEFFVVPFEKSSHCIRFCFPAPDYGRESKWLKFHNRFDLLKG